MKIRCLPLATALMCGAVASAAWSQAATPASAPAATAAKPAPGKVEPKLLSPAQKRDISTAPDETSQPAGPVIPQISIPLGRTAPAPTAKSALNGSKTKTTGGINDAAARCNAQTDAQAREACRDKLPK
jgi:hypothetical protein